jgi:hypothetical protein
MDDIKLRGLGKPTCGSCPFPVRSHCAAAHRLPINKNVVGHIHGLSSEGNAAVEHQVHEDFNNLVLGKANMECGADMSAPRAVAAQSRQASHGAQTTSGKVETGPGPGGAPVVFTRDAAKIPLCLGRRLGSRGGLVAHVLLAQLIVPLEQALGSPLGTVALGQRKIDAAFLEDGCAQGQGVKAD